jgi:hypothetical protein
VLVVDPGGVVPALGEPEHARRRVTVGVGVAGDAFDLRVAADLIEPLYVEDREGGLAAVG